MQTTRQSSGLRFSLGLKIGLGFAIGAAITIAVGVVGIVGITRISTTIDKTSIANKAFVAMNDVHASFAAFLASQSPVDAKATEGRIADVLETINQLDNGDENFANARKALGDLKAQIGTVAKANSDRTRALGDIQTAGIAMTDAIGRISDQAELMTEEAARDEVDALRTMDTINKIQPQVDQISLAVLKCASLIQKYIAAGDETLPFHIQMITTSLDRSLNDIAKAPLDQSIGKAAAVIAKLAKDNIEDVKALETLYATAHAPDAPDEARQALTAAAEDLANSFEGMATRVNGIRMSLTNSRNFAVTALQKAGQKRSKSKDIALTGQKATQQVSTLIIATKDFLANGGRMDPALVLREIDMMERLAKETDASGATEGVLGIVGEYRNSFDAILTALKTQNEVRKSAETAASEAVASISAIASKILAEANGTTSFQRILALVTLAIGCIVTLIFATMTARSVRNPITALTRIMARLAEGDTNVTPPGITRSDEIGEMSRTVEVFRDAAIEKRRLEAEASDDATARAERQHRIDAMIANFRAEIERMLAGVADQTAKMQGTAQKLNDAADQSQRQALSASGASSEASENVSTVAASAEELAASVHEISSRVQKTVEIVGMASEQASTSNDRIAGLAQAASRIGDVVKLIRSIADQTNLLALNATIEAARAGDAGKGFAVVAAEVKQLADQTAKATQEIAQQVEGIQSGTRAAVESIGEITRSMHTVNDYTASIAEAVAQQGQATSEISRNAQGASQGTQMVAHSMDTLVKTSEDTTEAASEVNSVAREVTDANATLTRTIDTFLETVAVA